MANRLKHATNFTVASFGDCDPVPAIRTLATTVFNRAELRHAIVQLHTRQKLLPLFFVQGPQNPHGVFTLQAETGVHQIVGQLA